MKLKALYFLISLFILTEFSSAQTVDETRHFADSLFNAGNLREALPAYQRTAFFIRPEVDAQVLRRIADCFNAGGETQMALEFYDHSYFAQSNDSLKQEVLFCKSACYLKNHDYQFALIELLNLNDSLSAGFESRRNFYLGICWFGLEDFMQAGTYFEKAVTDSLSKQKITAIFADTRLLHRPNPKTASWLSIFIPGAGQVYSGEIWQGINSFLLTTFFVGMAVYISVVTSPIDALFTSLPWFQRYYQGGFQRAEDLAMNKRAENRSRIFDQVLSVIATNK